MQAQTLEEFLDRRLRDRGVLPDFVECAFDVRLAGVFGEKQHRNCVVGGGLLLALPYGGNGDAVPCKDTCDSGEDARLVLDQASDIEAVEDFALGSKAELLVEDGEWLHPAGAAVSAVEGKVNQVGDDGACGGFPAGAAAVEHCRANHVPLHPQCIEDA